MAYCRFGESDAYVFMHVNGQYVCCACRLMEEGPGGMWQNFETENTAEIIKHLEEHRAKGHTIPEGAFERLRREYK